MYPENKKGIEAKNSRPFLNKKYLQLLGFLGDTLSENYPKSMVFENHRKSIIQHCERSELRLHFEWAKVN